MNVFTFSGNLGRDAAINMTQGGYQVCNFSVAASAGYGDKAQTVWVKCALWGNRASALHQYLTKGTRVVVSGELSMGEWTDQQGNNRVSPEVRVSEVTLMGSPEAAQAKQGGQQGGSTTQTQKSQPEATQAAEPDFGDLESDLPF